MELILEQGKNIYHKLECQVICPEEQDTAEVLNVPETYNTRDAPVMRDGKDYNPCRVCCQHNVDDARGNA